MQRTFLLILFTFLLNFSAGWAQLDAVQDSTFVSCDSLPLDAAMVRSVNQINNPYLTRSTEIVSDMLYPVTLGAPAVFLAYGNILNDRKLAETSALILAAEATTYGLVWVIKKFSDRPRPYIAYPDCITTRAHDPFKSFPSGHAAGSACILAMVSLQYPKWYVIIPSALYVGATNFSRMHLGLHYPSDVTVGSLMGFGIAFTIWKYQDVLLKPLEPIIAGDEPIGEMRMGAPSQKSIPLIEYSIPF